MKRIRLSLFVVVFIAGSSYSHPQGAHEQTARKNNASVRREKYQHDLQQIITSSAARQRVFADSLVRRLKGDRLRLRSNISGYFDSLYAEHRVALDMRRRDTLMRAYESLAGLIRVDENTVTQMSRRMTIEADKRLVIQWNSMVQNGTLSVQEYAENEETLKELAGDEHGAINDSCSTAYFTLLEAMDDAFYLVRDSLEATCSLLIDRQSAATDALDEVQSSRADSLAEVTADSLRYYRTNYSFYNSVSYGFDRNPLYYYEMPGDQLKQLFTQAMVQKNYARSALNVAYRGTMMAFNTFQVRNYYEHNLLAQYRVDYRGGKDSLVPKEAWSGADDFSNEKCSNLTMALNVSARWDKEFYKDYNNTGLEFAAAYKGRSNAAFIYDVKNTFGYRDYTIVNELSNVTDVVQCDVAHVSEGGFRNGLSLSAGVKYYTKTIYDTTFTVITTPGTGTGKNKTGAVEQTLTSVERQPNGSYQLTAALVSSRKGEKVSYEGRMLYRYDIRTEPRYLGMYVNTTFLSEDIYNEAFAYHGPEGRLMLTYETPFGFQLSGLGEIKHKTMNLPAFDLEGTTIASHRTDLASNAECALSQYFEIGKGMSVDMSLMLSVSRNQSNDEYNDYSSYSAAISIGVGF